MKVFVTRQRLDGLLKGAIKHSRSRRPLTDLTHDRLYDRMPANQRALLLGTISGGDETHSVSRWLIPGIGRRELIVARDVLAKVIQEAEPWAPPPPPELAARQSAARARLAQRRGLGADQLSLL